MVRESLFRIANRLRAEGFTELANLVYQVAEDRTKDEAETLLEILENR